MGVAKYIANLQEYFLFRDEILKYISLQYIICLIIVY